MKMDMDNIYFAAKVRDDLPLIYDRPDSLSGSVFNTEHLGVYIGLMTLETALNRPTLKLSRLSTLLQATRWRVVVHTVLLQVGMTLKQHLVLTTRSV